MGFYPEETLYKLTFEDPSYAGLEVFCASISVDAFERMTALASKTKSGIANDDTGEEVARASSQMLDQFSNALRSWNIEDRDGNPVPSTRIGIGTQQLDLILRIIAAWMQAIAGVSPPLQPNSSNGETSLGLQEMMAVSSQSHMN
jgi:hypothetical protein